jgi:hypothetical protein
MRWVITLSASKADMKRLLAESIETLSPRPDDPSQLRLELDDSFGDQATDETRQAVRQDIELRVRHLNGFGKLRWGRGYEGVEVKAVRSFDSTGADCSIALASAGALDAGVMLTGQLPVPIELTDGGAGVDGKSLYDLGEYAERVLDEARAVL